MLELAKKNNCRIVQASTSEVYGNPKQSPQTETYWGHVNPIGIRSCYDEGKRCAETLFFDYNRQYNVDTKVIRIFNTYGPCMAADDGRVVSNFIVQALQNKPITMYGDGSQTRSFCYVDDLIDGILKATFSSNPMPGPINLGNPTEFSITELANLVISLTNSKSTINYQALPQDDPKQRKPDIALAHELLQWSPQINLREGIEKTIVFFKNQMKNEPLKIIVIGAGYVGLVTGTCLAQKNNHVIIVETNKEKIEKLSQGKTPFYEPGIDDLLQNAIKNKNIEFTTNLKTALTHNPTYIFSCVGTPPQPNGSADLSAVYNVAKEVGQQINDYCIFINKSTVPVGTTKKIKSIIQKQLIQRNKNILFDVASNPEFLREGCAIQDFLSPDRVVVGTSNSKAKQLLFDLYKPFLHDEKQFIALATESSELTKYAANAMLALRISFINQLALFADTVGANIEEVKKGIIDDKRIGKHFLNAGIGYGGSCFPKDVNALACMGRENHCQLTLIEEIEEINNKQRLWFINKIIDRYHNNLTNKTIGIWGLAFKPETDDLRGAPSIDVIYALLKANAKIIAYDPVAQENMQKIFDKQVTWAKSSQEVLNSSDCLVLLTEWKEFLTYKPKDFITLKDKILFDGRNCFKPEEMVAAGIEYYSIGRNNVKAPEGHHSFSPKILKHISKITATEL